MTIMRTIQRPTTTGGFTYPCGLCNEFDVDVAVAVAGDLCSHCLGEHLRVCSRCGHSQQQYGPCTDCETGR